MENKRIRDTPVIVVPEGYEPWEVLKNGIQIEEEL